MSEEQNVEGVGAEEQTDSQETNAISTEQVEKIVEERLKKEREEINKQWQSRFDKVRNEKTEAEKALEDSEKTWQQRIQEEVSSVRKELESSKNEARVAHLRSQALKRVSMAELDLDDVEERLLYLQIDPTADDPLEDVDAYIEHEKQKREKIKLNNNAEYAKTHGRKVYDTKPSTWDGLTYKDLQAMPTEEFNRVPTEIIDKLTNAALENRR